MKKFVLAIALGFASFGASSQTNANKSLLNHTIDVVKYLTDKDIDSAHFNVLVDHLWKFTKVKDSLLQTVTKTAYNVDSIIFDIYYTKTDSVFNKFLYNKQFDQLDIDINSRVKNYTTMEGKSGTLYYDDILFAMYTDNNLTMFFEITILNNKIDGFKVVTYPLNVL